MAGSGCRCRVGAGDDIQLLDLDAVAEPQHALAGGDAAVHLQEKATSRSRPQSSLRGAGLLRVSGAAPDGLFFELGLRPGASPLVRYRSGDIAVPDFAAADAG